MQLFNNDIRIERQRFQFTCVALAPANGYAQKNSAERFSALKYGNVVLSEILVNFALSLYTSFLFDILVEKTALIYFIGHTGRA